jgi:hypothetical protein
MPYMYDIYNKRGEHIGEFTPGGPGCNYYGKVAIDVNNPPKEIKAYHTTAKLNPEWKKD